MDGLWRLERGSPIHPLRLYKKQVYKSQTNPNQTWRIQHAKHVTSKGNPSDAQSARTGRNLGNPGGKPWGFPRAAPPEALASTRAVVDRGSQRNPLRAGFTRLIWSTPGARSKSYVQSLLHSLAYSKQYTKKCWRRRGSQREATRGSYGFLLFSDKCGCFGKGDAQFMMHLSCFPDPGTSQDGSGCFPGFFLVS